MTRFKFLLLGTSLSFLPTLSLAQCVETTNCETLGYTETSCNGGKGVKCPFGNKWFCFETEDEFKTRLCPELGFTLDCSGENQTNSSYSCNGKYNYCNCADGYHWKDGKCEKTEQVQNGPQGDLYYCDGKVVGVKAPNMNFYVAMNDIDFASNLDDAENDCSAYRFCAYAKGILPTKDQFFVMYQNKAILESLLTSNGGSKFIIDDEYWASDRYAVYMFDGTARYVSNTSNQYYVRPVLDF